MEIRKMDWQIEILLITAKTGFCNLIFYMLASDVGPKCPKDFCNILIWQSYMITASVMKESVAS